MLLLTVSVDTFSNDEVFLFVFDSLQTCCEVSNFSFDGEHLAFVGDVNDAVNVKTDRLVGNGAELVAEAVRVTTVVLCGKRVSAGVFALLLEQWT